MSESSQKLDLIRHALEGARSSLPLPECADLACDLKAEIEATTAKTQALSSPAGTCQTSLVFIYMRSQIFQNGTLCAVSAGLERKKLTGNKLAQLKVSSLSFYENK